MATSRSRSFPHSHSLLLFLHLSSCLSLSTQHHKCNCWIYESYFYLSTVYTEENPTLYGQFAYLTRLWLDDRERPLPLISPPNCYFFYCYYYYYWRRVIKRFKYWMRDSWKCSNENFSIILWKRDFIARGNDEFKYKILFTMLFSYSLLYILIYYSWKNNEHCIYH